MSEVCDKMITSSTDRTEMLNQVAITLQPNDEAFVEFFEVGKSYDMLSDRVGGMIECVHIGEGIDMWVNENFIQEQLDYNATASGIYWIAYGFMSGSILGNVVFTSSDGMGETIGLNVDQINYLKKIAFDIVGIVPDLRESYVL